MIFRRIHLQDFEECHSDWMVPKMKGTHDFDNAYHLRKLSLSKSLINGLKDFS